MSRTTPPSAPPPTPFAPASAASITSSSPPAAGGPARIRRVGGGEDRQAGAAGPLADAGRRGGDGGVPRLRPGRECDGADDQRGRRLRDALVIVPRRSAAVRTAAERRGTIN